MTNWKSVSVGASHAIAIKTDRTIWAWGYNYEGELGDGSQNDKSSPIQVGSLTNWKSVSSGFYQSFAIK